ncbi:hypothetical protein KY284_012447 [Solanum tuberosum]|nr:hypothetical protein KY284_012447 [Solanum tuberosum]
MKNLKLEDQKQQIIETDYSSNSSSNNNIIPIRVCSDCNTTKTPLWRSGPKGPKLSLELFAGIHRSSVGGGGNRCSQLIGKGVIGAAITEQLYKEKYWEEHPGQEVPLMKPMFYGGPWRVMRGDVPPMGKFDL